MKYSTHKILLLGFTAMLVLGCNTDSETGSTEPPSDSILQDTNEIITNKRVDNIKTALIKKGVIHEIIRAKGNIETPPNSRAGVSAPMGGFIKEARFYTGRYVPKGTVLAILEHPSYIQLQQQYLRAKNELEYYKADFTRQGQLTVENAASVKQMQEAEVKYRTTEVDYLALRAQMQLLGLNPDSIHEDGISATIELKAPISGHISSINASIGKYAPDNEVLYQIINNKHIQVHLQVYEKDIVKIQPGYTITFKLINNADNTYKARIHTISQNVNKETGRINVHAHLIENYPELLPGMYVNAEIDIPSDSVYILPKNAVFREGEKSWAYLQFNNTFKKIEIETGSTNNENVAILNLADSLLQYPFVVEGTYYIHASKSHEK
ncbi:MAG: efflux RND transporter periplasmic adaptor subunit [Bacteroidetes bacterium]|nr:efflux RND transporter periplasmic adaptor subunit [Bacteroidota bacterium]